MGEAGFAPLSQLNPSKQRCRVRVRISRLWVSFNPNKGTVFGLDSLLIDDQGGTMQARVHPMYKKHLEGRLVEGKVYALSGFVVCVSEGKYMTCRNHFMMHIGPQTVVDEIDGDVGSIPLHSFDFADFGDVPSRNCNNNLLTDVIGQVVEVRPVQEVQKKFRMIPICSLWIKDLSGKEQEVTLYEKLANDFYAEIREKCRQGLVVAVFAGMCVRHYKGKGYIVCSSPPSKYYLDLEIPEAQEFRMNWDHPKIPIVHPQSQQESPADPTQESSQGISKLVQELQSSWRTIKQLESVDLSELPENARFLCRVSLVKIDCTKVWCYQGCFHCRRSISGDGSDVWCNRCDSVNKKRKRPVWWYKLDAVVEDATGTMNLMIFADEAQGLIGVAAEDLVDEITENRHTMPDVIKNLIGSTHAFQVAIDHRSWSLGFVVKWVLDDDALMLLQHIGSSQMTVGGGDSPLPEEEGSSSASGCSSQLTEPIVAKRETELKMVIVAKRETELKTEDEALESGGRC